ncbi:MAG: bifunctional pyr operon transcriptional regulator/uracil phosphoribosyltransferase PyrR [Mariprofundaceae bacterium]|nr:bifunctional pyr operon transcriptional regulator/uracil phosphoribosyltransferase PyrR [Mariprofundaceae bacterium]
MPDIIFDSTAVHAALDRMAEEMVALAIRKTGEKNRDATVCLIGIERGGARVADAIQMRLEAAGQTLERGNLDISFYRDDLDTIGANPEVRPSNLPFDIGGRNIWLVDDVLYTGRTIRAALGELFDYGRPATIHLAVLLDRGGRELPIAADVTGLNHVADTGCSVKLLCQDDWHIEQRRVKP